MLFTGTTEIDFKGQKIGLKFGTLSSGIFCEQENITLSEMVQRLNKPTPFTFIHIYFAAAKAYAMSNKIDFIYSVSDAADWIDELGFHKASELIFQLMQVYQDKEEKKVQTPEAMPG